MAEVGAESLGGYFHRTDVENDLFKALLYDFTVDSAGPIKEFHRLGLDFQLVPFLQDPKNVDLPISVGGICDNTGTAAHNQDLSEQRADTVVTELRTKHGIADERMIAKGFGIVQQNFTPPQLHDTAAPGRNKLHRGVIISVGPLKGAVPPPDMAAPLDETLDNDEILVVINAL